MTVFTINPDRPDSADVARIAQLVRQGGVIIYPTETVYGLGGNGLNPEVIERIYRLKGRDRNKPLSLIIDSTAWLEVLVRDIPDQARRLMDGFWPGPLTIVFKATTEVPSAVAGTRGTVALRVSGNPLCTRLAREAGCPLVATSANPSGGSDHFRIDTIPTGLREQVDALVDGGLTRGREPSTVIDMADRPGTILRSGSIAADRIATVLGS